MSNNRATTSLRRTAKHVLVVAATVAALAGPVVVLGGGAPAGAATSPVPDHFVTVVDQGGPNDVNSEQNDLTQMGRDDTSFPGKYDLFWSWDTTNFTAQAGNACALFDSDGDGNINFAVCAEVDNVPSGDTSVVEQTTRSPLAVTCSDQKPDRCTQPSNPLPFTSADIESGDLFNLDPSPPANLVTATDPFPNLNPDQTWPNDTSIQLLIAQSFLPTGSQLANVCSYPSLGNTGNNNPFDCVLVPGSGLLKITKVAPTGTTQSFDFTVNPGSISKSITGPGSTAPFGVAIGTDYSVAETVPSGWHLDSASCLKEDGTSTGTFSGSSLTGVTVESGKMTTCTFTDNQPPSLAVLKDNDANRDTTFSDSETIPADVVYPQTVTYKATITNSSPSSATITSITDDKASAPLSLTSATTAPAGAASCASLIGSTIAGGATLTCYFDVVYTSPGTTPVTDTLTAVATNKAGTDTKTDTSTVTFTAQSKSLTLTKTDDLNPAKYDHVGQVVTYTLTATNSGNVTLHNVSVSDDPALDGFTCTPALPVASLAPGATVKCTGTHTITQTDLEAGKYDNTASATSTEATAPNAKDTIYAQQTAKLTLTKTDSLSAKYDHVGQVVTYTLTATNTGNITLHNVSVSDSPALDGFACTPDIPVVSLAPGAAVKCTGTHTITQADLDAGQFENTASATSTEATAPDAKDTIYADKKAALSLTKTDDLNPSSYDHTGQVVTYTLTATNEGNVTLHNVTVTDTPALDGFGCTPAVPLADLAPGATVKCTGTHTITQQDLDHGSFADTGTATSTEATAPPAPDIIHAAQNPVLTLTKTDNLNPEAYDHTGQVVTYTLTATNEGNVTLYNVTVTDTPALDGFGCTPAVPLADLAPGATVKCTGTHTITQQDLDHGSFADTGTATSTEATAPPAPDIIHAAQNPVLTLTKTDSLNGAQYDHVGQVVSYTLIAENIGNVTLHDVTVTDTPPLDGFTCFPVSPATLLPGQEMVCTGTHAITQQDLDNGSYSNIGKAGSTEAPPAEAPDEVTAAQRFVLEVAKTDDLNPKKYEQIGQAVTYTLTATNTGNVTLHQVTVTDAPALDNFTCTPALPVASLAPGDSVVCTGIHLITQPDLDAGFFSDEATAVSTEAAAPPAPDTVYGAKNAKLELTKTDSLGTAKYDQVGQEVGYTLTATNTGNVTLHNVTVTDAPALDGFTCTPALPVASLAPGDSVICTGTHTITQADLDQGWFSDTGNATSNEADAPPATDTIFAAQNAALALSKVDDLNPAKYDHVGQVVTYTLTAKNTGNVTLHNVVVSDSALLVLTCTPSIPATLLPGDSVVCTGTHSITQADLDNGQFTNTAGATSDKATAPDATDIIYAAQSAALALSKGDNLNPAHYDHVGQVVTYALTATNTGNVTLYNVSVSDDPALDGFACTPTIPTALLPGDSAVCTGTHTITQADLDAGSFVDTASATSTEAAAPDATDTIFAEQKAALSLTKTDDLNPARYDHVGQVVTYTLTAANTGNVTQHNVSVSDDPALDGFACTPLSGSDLAPGASMICTGTHTITQADLDAGKYTDIGTVDSNETQPVTADDTIRATQNPAMTLSKTDDLNPGTYDHVGQVVTYTLTAKNTGNITLHNVTVTDAPALDGFACTPASGSDLAPGQSMICTGTHTITQADLDAGSFKDIGTVTSTETQPVTADDTIRAAQNPAMTLTKIDSLGMAEYDHVGQVVTYTLTAANTGNVTLHNVSVSDDPALDGFACTPPSGSDLAPGASMVCTGTHTITQADLDYGSFKDIATATSNETLPVTADDTIQAARNPAMTLSKTDDLNPATYDHVGQVVTYTLTAKNTGNITLHNVTVTDAPALDGFACTPPSGSDLAPGGSMVCTGTHTITQADLDAGKYTDIGTVDSNETTPVDTPDTVYSQSGQITPTGTTCSQFASGTAANLDSIQYLVKGNKINSVSPGVMFYWVKVSGGGAYTITQTLSPNTLTTRFTMAPGSAVWDSGCTKVGSATLAQSKSDGSVRVTFTGTGTFYIGIKYDPGSVVGKTKPNPPDVTYTFATSGVSGSSDSVLLTPKNAALNKQH